MKETFKADIEGIRKRAREEMAKGAVTGAYTADREQVIEVLNAALATEIICVLRYKNHYYRAEGLDSEPAAAEFHQHAEEEQRHADQLAQRITQLGGEPNFDPEGITDRAHATYERGADLKAMIEEDLVAERVAVEMYAEVARWLGDDDRTTRNLIESILAQEEEHADDLAGLLTRMSN